MRFPAHHTRKCLRFPVTTYSAFAAKAHSRNTSSSGSEHALTRSDGLTQNPFSRIAWRAAIRRWERRRNDVSATLKPGAPDDLFVLRLDTAANAQLDRTAQGQHKHLSGWTERLQQCGYNNIGVENNPDHGPGRNSDSSRAFRGPPRFRRRSPPSKADRGLQPANCPRTEEANPEPDLARLFPGHTARRKAPLPALWPRARHSVRPEVRSSTRSWLSPHVRTSVPANTKP